MWHDALQAASKKGQDEGIHWGMPLVGALVVIFFFGVLLNRLYQMQIVEYEEAIALAERNYLRTHSKQAYRGMLKDRRGAIFAENRPSLNLYIYPYDVRDPEAEIELLSHILSLSPKDKEFLADTIAKSASGGPRERVFLKQDLSRQQVALIEARHLDLPSIRIEPSTKRYYPLGSLASHLIGYMKEVTPEELDRREGYEPGDLIGKTGIERAFEEILRGSKGIHREVRDFRENVQSEEIARRYYNGERQKDPVAGNDIILTLDAELERATEIAFRGYRSGAAVVLEAKTGRVLALYSKPGYDLNEITKGLSPKRKAELDQNPDSLWLNKALEVYPPGSTFKVVTALAALEAGIKPEAQVFCPGAFYLGRYRFRCHSTHGYVNAWQAIARSCDTYFYTRSLEVGIDSLAKYGKAFGLGTPTGLGVGSDRRGIMPSTDWYKKVERPFSGGMTVNASIGQGDVLTSPLQQAVLYAAIANGGTLLTPQVLERIENTAGETISSFSPRIQHQIPAKEENIRILHEGLIDVTQNGTLRSKVRPYADYKIAGKTGTAQVRRIGAVRQRTADMEYLSRHHAWVAAYAPYDDPEIVVVVLVEHGGGGGTAAGPVTMEIISRYFDIFGDTPQKKRKKPLPHEKEAPFVQTPLSSPFLSPEETVGGAH